VKASEYFERHNTNITHLICSNKSSCVLNLHVADKELRYLYIIIINFI